jgi:hypothetical protein
MGIKFLSSSLAVTIVYPNVDRQAGIETVHLSDSAFSFRANP